MKTSIIMTIEEATTDKKRKRSVTDINPNATNAELKDFAQTFVGMTTGRYVETERVDKTNVDNEESHKSFRNIKITNATQGSTATITMNVDANEETNPAVFFYSNSTVTILSATRGENPTPTTAIFTISIPNSSGSLFVGTREKESFYSEFAFAAVE